MSFKVSFKKTFFRLLVVIMMLLCVQPSLVLAVAVTSDKTISSNVTAQQKIQTNDNVTLTIDAEINLDGNSAVLVQSGRSGATIIINSGGSVINTDTSTNDYAIKAQSGTNVTITNSGLVVAPDSYAIDVNNSTGATITNNAGGIVYADRLAIAAAASGTSDLTLTNHGTVYITEKASTINFQEASNVTLTNKGQIYRESGAQSNDHVDQSTIKLGSSSTLINTGQIRNDASQTIRSIYLNGGSNTIILRDEGIVTGVIAAASGTTGNKLQLDHGFGRSYFYETSGDFTLEDLSGNTVLKGSAGSVSLARQETVDEMLGLRSFNLRSALKRYASAPMSSDDNMVWGETFGYTQKRGGTDTLLKYDTHGYGMNFIYPVMSKLGLILSVERNQLDFAEEYEVSRTGFLAGFNVPEFSGFGKGNWKLGGFAVAGMGWYDSTREILTNTTSTGLLDVTADYQSVEVITGLNIKNTHKLPSNGWIKNKWDTEMGLTLQGSNTPDYNERHYFSFEERTLIQESVHFGEQLTSTFNDRLAITLGLEYEYRFVLAGKNQTYRVNGALADYDDGSFSQNSGSGNLGLSYRFGSKSKLNQGLAYIQFNSRLSDETRGTYGGSLGISINF